MKTVGSASAEREEMLKANRQWRAGWPEWACLSLYAGLVAWMIPYHEPWADEAQAWMLARSLSLGQLFATYLRYEGQPGLWHGLLWALIRLHVSYAGMHWIAGAIACAGMAVFVLRSPFPRWLKLTAPFTFFFAFQYAVVARNYVLIPLLLFGACALWRRSAIGVALLLGLLANVAGHAAAIAGGFALAWCMEWFLPGARTDRAETAKSLWIAGLLFSVLCILAVLTAFPTHDVYTAGPLDRTHVEAALGALVWATWEPMTLALAGWLLVLWGMRWRRALYLLIPAGTLLLFCTFVYMSFWHAGLMVPVLLAALWLSWPPRGSTLGAPEIALRFAVAALIAAQIGWTAHAAWFDHYQAFSPDKETAQFLKPYIDAGDQVAVTYVRENVTRAFHLVGVEPYFSQKIFMNQPTPFWWWSRSDRTEANFLAALAQHPQVVLANSEIYSATTADAAADLSSPPVAAKVQFIEGHGYRLAQTFCTVKPERFTYRESVCDLVFLSTEPSGASH